MKPLPTTFRFDGFSFRQLERIGMIALFAKRNKRMDRDTYEVVRLQVWPAQTIRGIEYPEREAMPWENSWGKHGWSYMALEDAKRKFDSLAIPA